MVKQGSIIKVNLNPSKGHEQEGYRPALVISNNYFNSKAKLAIVCPISNTKHDFPLHIPLDERTSTSGSILCEHVRTLDIETRGYEFIEIVPEDLLKTILDIVCSQIEII